MLQSLLKEGVFALDVRRATILPPGMYPAQ